MVVKVQLRGGWELHIFLKHFHGAINCVLALLHVATREKLFQGPYSVIYSIGSAGSLILINLVEIDAKILYFLKNKLFILIMFFYQCIPVCYTHDVCKVTRFFRMAKQCFFSYKH